MIPAGLWCRRPHSFRADVDSHTVENKISSATIIGVCSNLRSMDLENPWYWWIIVWDQMHLANNGCHIILIFKIHPSEERWLTDKLPEIWKKLFDPVLLDWRFKWNEQMLVAWPARDEHMCTKTIKISYHDDFQNHKLLKCELKFVEMPMLHNVHTDEEKVLRSSVPSKGFVSKSREQ